MKGKGGNEKYVLVKNVNESQTKENKNRKIEERVKQTYIKKRKEDRTTDVQADVHKDDIER